jgi:hypothetical protein
MQLFGPLMIKCDILFLCGNQVRFELRNFKLDIVNPTLPIASSIETLRVKCTLSPQHIVHKLARATGFRVSF